MSFRQLLTAATAAAVILVAAKSSAQELSADELPRFVPNGAVAGLSFRDIPSLRAEIETIYGEDMWDLMESLSGEPVSEDNLWVNAVNSFELGGAFAVVYWVDVETVHSGLYTEWVGLPDSHAWIREAMQQEGVIQSGGQWRSDQELIWVVDDRIHALWIAEPVEGESAALRAEATDDLFDRVSESLRPASPYWPIEPAIECELDTRVLYTPYSESGRFDSWGGMMGVDLRSACLELQACGQMNLGLDQDMSPLFVPIDPVPVETLARFGAEARAGVYVELDLAMGLQMLRAEGVVSSFVEDLVLDTVGYTLPDLVDAFDGRVVSSVASQEQDIFELGLGVADAGVVRNSLDAIAALSGFPELIPDPDADRWEFKLDDSFSAFLQLSDSMLTITNRSESLEVLTASLSASELSTRVEWANDLRAGDRVIVWTSGEASLRMAMQQLPGVPAELRGLIDFADGSADFVNDFFRLEVRARVTSASLDEAARWLVGTATGVRLPAEDEAQANTLDE